MASAQEDDEPIYGINVTPLVDITLVLLIIFMATAHIIVHRSMSLSLPKVANARRSPRKASRFSWKRTNRLRLNNQPVTLQDLSVNLAQMARLDPGLKVTLSADERVTWGDVAAILDAIRGAGITHIATEVEPKKAK